MMRIIRVLLCLSASLFFASAQARLVVKVVNTRVEMLTNPVGIDILRPNLSWQLQSGKPNVVQRSYRVLVASTPELLKKDKGDLWNSGTILSDHCNYIRYDGQPLVSGRRCYWKVQVVTNRGQAASETGFWEMSLLQPSDWKARWIGRAYSSDNLNGNTRVRARYLRKDFEVDEVVTHATLYICGLGLYKVAVNGEVIGRQELSPTPTDYNMSVRYNTFDVTAAVRQGRNAIGVILGNGRFTSMRIPGILHFGLPQLLCQLMVTTADGQQHLVVSDDTWKITATGPIGCNSEYDGEEFDARWQMPGWTLSGFDDSRWDQAELVSAPKGKLLAQLNPNIMAQDTLRPRWIRREANGRYLLDMGQNMVGWMQVKVKGEAGDTLRFHFVETLKADSTIYTANLRSAETTDTYVCDGTATTWQPSFTYHGFRYVEISGYREAPCLDDFRGVVLYDKMATTGELSTSNELLNRIYHNAYWGIRGNYRGMPTDCPQRDERMGWLGDRAMGALGECFIFDNHRLYAKWLQDIAETQSVDGIVSDVAPRYWDVYNDDVTWPAAWFTVANMLYDQYGDMEPIRKHYDAMKRWMMHIVNHNMKDNIVLKDVYGDWCMPPERQELIHSEDPKRQTEGALLATAFYHQLLKLMARFASLNGNADSAMWNAKSDSVATAFNRRFYHPDGSCYGNNTVTANILPLRMGIIPEGYRAGVFRNIVNKTMIDFGSHVSTGLIGIQQLMRGLTENGRGDLALQIATNTTYPSWGYMVEHGATTIWELWNGDTADPAMNSGNHVMLLGDLVIWLYNYLGGIGQTPGSVAYKHVQLKPYLIAGIDSVRVSYQSVYGPIVSRWKRAGTSFSWHFEIPANTSARICFPVSGLVDVEPLRRQFDGFHAVYQGMEGAYAVFEVPSGVYDAKL